jgi:hypothetical protein
MSDEDLVYDGRARKRPPGANSTVIEIFDLLDTHSDGMTIEEIWKALRAGFPTDAYRAYEGRLNHDRDKRASKGGELARSVVAPLRLRYGTPEFKAHAEHWWIQAKLKSMKESGTARREGDLWLRGDRAPLIHITCEAGYGHLVEYDSKKGRAEDEARVRRAHLREEARAVLANKGLSAKARKVIEQLMELT